MLYTGEQIAEIYSTEAVKITTNTVRRWANNGLKHLLGEKGKFLFKKEWIDEFLEEEAKKNIHTQVIGEKSKKTNLKKNHKVRNFNFEECKII